MTLSYIPADTNDEGILKATASGVLPNGKPVVVNADGTVSVVAETSLTQTLGTPVAFVTSFPTYADAIYDPDTQKVIIAYYISGTADGYAIVGTVSGTSISFGTAVLFDRATQNISMVYDPDSQKVVIAYEDDFNLEYGTAIVGTVSGNSISFGSPTVFESSAIGDVISATYDTNAQKVVLAYQDSGNSGYGTAVVGTVGGTSISFGSPVVFESASSSSISAVYAANTQKVVIVYTDGGNSFSGTAVVGTVSGTSISFGAPAVHTFGGGSYNSAVYDTTEQKVVISYQGVPPNRYGTAVVATVSGTSISFGTPVVFESAQTEFVKASYDTNAQKVVVTYQDDGNSSYGTLAVGTVSGTSISFGSPVVFNAAESGPRSTVYDASNKKVVIVYYSNLGGPYVGDSVVFQNASTDVNLTASNYIGISTGGTYASGSNATVKIIGNTSDEQSGLTAGQSYYVQTDGTLGLTPATPSVFAGTAISANKILVKT